MENIMHPIYVGRIFSLLIFLIQIDTLIDGTKPEQAADKHRLKYMYFVVQSSSAASMKFLLQHMSTSGQHFNIFLEDVTMLR